MEKQLNKELIDNLFEKISSDSLFSKSPRYTSLFEFLVKHALEEKHLKEQTIGIDLFKKNYNQDKNDGIVRVYMYNLRKKLKKYYEGAGKEDPIVFSLEKGSYNLKFIPKVESQKDKSLEKDSTRTRNYLRDFALLLTIPILGLIIYSILFLVNQKEWYCWDSFLEGGISVNCMISDQIVIMEHDELNRSIGILHHGINSHSDVTRLALEDELEIANYTSFSKTIPFSVNKLSNWFAQYEKEIHLIPENELRYKEVHKGNMIYVGQFKNMNISKELFLKNSSVFKYQKHYLSYQEKGKEIAYTPIYKKGVVLEYAMVSYLPLEGVHKALFFTSNHDIGVTGTLKKFINNEWLASFYKKNKLSKSSYFNALFEVTGVERTDIKCTLVQLEILDNE